MPVIGEIKRGRDLGKKYKNGAYIFSACEVCGSERWVEYRNGKAKDAKCQKCVNKGKSGMKLTHPNKDIVAQVGDIKTGGELGLNFKTQKYIYEACKRCGHKRWVQIQSAGKYSKCVKCTNKGKLGDKNGRWTGGRNINKFGYIEVKLQPDSSFYPMAKASGYVLEHRLVIAQQIGRCLEDWEIVHHIDSVKTHNNPENLLLVVVEGHNTRVEHILIRQDKEIKSLQATVVSLMARMSINEAEKIVSDMEVCNDIIRE